MSTGSAYRLAMIATLATGPVRGESATQTPNMVVDVPLASAVVHTAGGSVRGTVRPGCLNLNVWTRS